MNGSNIDGMQRRKKSVYKALGINGGSVEVNYFSYITGIASLLGFIAQALDWFPTHKGLRKFVTALLLGAFLGSFSNILQQSSIVFDFTVSGFVLLLLMLGGILALLITVAILTQDSQRRTEIYVVSGILGFVFSMVLMIGGATQIDNSASAIQSEKNRLTISELIVLSELAAERSDFDRALMHLDMIKRRLDSNDSRVNELNTRIESIKDKQI
ncbi:hypothetical protein ACP3V5_05585 [Vibrio maritimus]